MSHPAPTQLTLADFAEDGLILCANQRLARSLRARHDSGAAQAGKSRWRPLAAMTPGQWLDIVVDQALLGGEIPLAAAPQLALSNLQERLLWEAAIAVTAVAGEDALFDTAGLAAAAAEANGLCEIWGLRPDEAAGAETERFLAWRAAVRRQCQAHGWLEAARWRAWQIRGLAQGAGRLPAKVAFAGFDRYTPQELELARILETRGVTVSELALGRSAPGQAQTAALADRKAECRAVAAWAAERLAAQPAARLGVVAPELTGVRELLAAALDDALHPEALGPGHGELPRCYNFSLGTPLARQPIVAVALALLQVAANPRRGDQAVLADLLLGPYWSAWEGEADGRARLAAAMRRHLPPRFAVGRLLALARRQESRGLHWPRSRSHLEILAAASEAEGRKRLPSAWGQTLAELLERAGWPGERSLSSHEWQARRALLETLAGLAEFDAMLGRISLTEACRQLSRLCRERVFQVETEGQSSIELMGPLEAAGLEFDALWVLGMNDDSWPPPPRPNPLLPAELQRRAKSANASAEVQLAFARSVHGRLLRAAPEVVFSWARGEGDRQLRPSPLLAGLPDWPAVPLPLPNPLAAQVGRAVMAQVDDYQAPPVAAGEEVKGGTGLLKAQALCPAWAFYRYRLGAKALDEPVEGLDAIDRGTLLHRVLEKFWQGRSQALVATMAADERQAAVRAAVLAGLESFAGEREEPLPPRFAALEALRLEALLGQWLELELARSVPFVVVACEAPAEVAIEGITISLKMDRIDELPDGRRLILDYKTGGDLKARAWEGERLAEPQLPVYAAFVGAEPTGVAFAQVRAGDCAFVGLAAEAGLLPGVKATEDWPATVEHWRAAIAAIAREIREGYAPVSYAREEDLRYCEVLPLLRLAEAKAQREAP